MRLAFVQKDNAIGRASVLYRALDLVPKDLGYTFRVLLIVFVKNVYFI